MNGFSDFNLEKKEKPTVPNEAGMVLKNCGKIVWVLTIVYIVIMLIVGLEAAASSLLSPVSAFFKNIASAAVGSIGGFISGALLAGFGELLIILSDIRDTMKRK